MYQLRATTVHEIHGISAKGWDPVYPWYPVFLETVFDKTNDVALHMLLFGIAANHFVQLEGSSACADLDLQVLLWFQGAVSKITKARVLGRRETGKAIDAMYVQY